MRNPHPQLSHDGVNAGMALSLRPITCFSRAKCRATVCGDPIACVAPIVPDRACEEAYSSKDRCAGKLTQVALGPST